MSSRIFLIDHPQLVIFVGGNYFFAMAPLVAAFEKEYPELKGKIYYETLPPGILIRQVRQGNTITVGNMTWKIQPDVYAAGLKRVNYLIHQGLVQGPAVPYVTNDLTIMIPKGNPAHIKTLRDLGKPGVRLSIPNPKWRGWHGKSRFRCARPVVPLWSEWSMTPRSRMEKPS